MLLDAVRGKPQPGAGAGEAAAPLAAAGPSRSGKKQRSIHDFFSQDMTCRSGHKPRARARAEEHARVQKRIDYDACEDESSEEPLREASQASEDGPAAAWPHQQPKKIDFALFSSQRSEPDGEPSDGTALSTPRRAVGWPPSASQTLSTPVRSSQVPVGLSQLSQYSQDELDFLTPRDQPVVQLSNPTTPSPLKKRPRLHSDGDMDRLREQQRLQHLTQDMTHVHVRQARRGPPSLASDAGASPMDAALLAPTPRQGAHTGHGVVVTRREARPRGGNQAATLLSPESLVNPFAPEPAAHSGQKKRSRRKRRPFPAAWPDAPSGQPMSKYLADFSEQELIGSGSFSKVYKCLKKLDGWVYAVKKSKRHFRGKADTERALREVQALAALSSSQHVVRYFDAWIEDDLLYIQLEHCRGCALADFVDKYAPHAIPEATLCKVLCHVAQALFDMHSQKIVHMDVKLQNVLLGPGDVYKLGDLGTAAHLDGSMEITEGDNRYLSRELLEGSRTNLRAGDIFALGATIYELALGATLPSCGEEWQKIRDGDLVMFRQYSNSLQHLIASMMHPDALQRPLAEEILQHEVVLPFR